MNIEHDNLEDFADANNYDLEDNSETGVAFYAALAHETGGPVLEIGCGTGRVSIPIASQGLAVTGLDIVPGMLERARRKSASLPVHWVEGDGRDFELGERFRLIFLTGNTIQLFLTRTDQEALLEQVHRHLHDAGLFAFETRNPCWRRGAVSFQDDEVLSHQPFPDAEGLFAYLETWGAEEIDPPIRTVKDAKSIAPERRSMTTFLKSCSGPGTDAGRRTLRSRRVPRVSQYAILFPRSWKRCCTTTVFRESVATAIGIVRL